MPNNYLIAFYVLIMVAVIFGVDFLFLRGHPVARLITNILIVVAFGAAYMHWFRQP